MVNLKKIRVYCFLTLLIFLFSSEISAFKIECPEYEKGNFFYYSSVGILNQIKNDCFIISDKTLKRNGSTSYHGLKRRHIPQSEFKKGAVVGYKLNDKNEITDIYLIKKSFD
ncbi:MAG: hypothetical protein H6681_04155 [Desulfobacteraceae bacterium]|nr:hypothetical protein [Desulfobacteraceae bacterium]MCB9494621.1 hypothetical protein [Desulfobacteraceae bacterium]